MVNAEIFRMADRIGSVEPGRYADLLIVEGNPLKDLGVFQNSTHLHAIVKAGVFVKRALSSHSPARDRGNFRPCVNEDDARRPPARQSTATSQPTRDGRPAWRWGRTEPGCLDRIHRCL